MPNNPIRIIIADDYPIIQRGLRMVSAEEYRIEIAGMAASFAEVHTLLSQTTADVLILDILGMGGAPIGMVTRVRQQFPTLAIVIFSSSIDLAPELLRRGVMGYVAKEERIDELLRAITLAAAGESYRSPIVRDYLEHSQATRPVSPKELMALKLLAQGLTTIEIAAQMEVDARTVQNHITALRRKTGCLQRTQLVDWYRRAYGTPATESP